LKTLYKFFIKPACFWAVLAAAGLILSVSAVNAEESAPSGQQADGYIFTMNPKSAEALYEMKERRMKAVETRRAELEAKARKQEKKAKIDKLQGKTGRVAKSWQVLNR
jgi:hypothetical protein